jgi:Tol biopolymer transport system component
MKRFLLVICLLLAFPPGSPAAKFDPAFNFKEIETAHFSIYYHQGLEEMAGRAATIAEEVHLKLATLLQWQPEEKTHIVIVDNSDFANGMTTVVPYNVIYLQTAPPGATSAIGEYDNWLRLLIIHEYAHVLTSDPVRGYSAVSRRIFGKVVPMGDILNLLVFAITGPPNMMMPRWWHEGMATWAETELTAAGRGRNSYYQMIYRTAVAEDNLLSIDRINGDIPYYPSGDSPYIFGSRLIQYMADTYGTSIPGSISIQQSGRLPYLINGAPVDQIDGKGYPVLYAEMLAAMKAGQREKISRLEENPFTTVSTISREAVSETNPRFSHNGKMIALNRNDLRSYPQLVIMERSGREIASIRRLYGDGNLCWSADDRGVIFSQARMTDTENNYQDIYFYDLAKQRLQRLTSGMRAGKPDLSPDGRQLAVVTSSLGGENLAVLEFADLLKKSEDSRPRLLTSFNQQRLSAPRWSPDGKSIAFTSTDMGGKSTLSLIEPLSAARLDLLATTDTIDAPAWSPDGRAIFYSADHNGVFNIHRLDIASQRTFPVSHLLSGGFTPDIAADETLAIGKYTSQGQVIGLIEEIDRNRDPAPLPVIRERHQQADATPATEAPAAGSALPTATDYSPLETLLPKFWMPVMISEGPGDIAIGALTGGQDILGYHTYVTRVMRGSGFDKNYYDLQYSYGRHVPVFSLYGYALPATYGSLLASGDYTELEQGGIATVTLPLKVIDGGFSLHAGYHLRKQKHLSPLTGVSFSGKPVFEGRRDSIFAAVDYRTAVKYPWSIAVEDGRSISVKTEYYGRETGSDLESREHTASWEENFSMGGQHTLMAKVSGGMADGQQSPQASFRLGALTSPLNPFGLRGYGSFLSTGNRIATGTIEHRFPLYYLLHGFTTKPLFLDRLHGALFVDAGEVWSRKRSFKSRDLLYGAGGEIRFDMTIGYWLKITPAIGYAYGFDRKLGGGQLYFNIYANF